MRKRCKGKKLSRTKNQRSALLKSLAASLIIRKRIKTTETRAKALRPFVEKLVTYSKNPNPIIVNRQLIRFLPKKVAKILIEHITPLFKDRKGGYLKIIKLAPRVSDAAKMAFVEFLIPVKEKSLKHEKKANPSKS